MCKGLTKSGVQCKNKAVEYCYLHKPTPIMPTDNFLKEIISLKNENKKIRQNEQKIKDENILLKNENELLKSNDFVLQNNLIILKNENELLKSNDFVLQNNLIKTKTEIIKLKNAVNTKNQKIEKYEQKERVLLDYQRIANFITTENNKFNLYGFTDFLSIPYIENMIKNNFNVELNEFKLFYHNLKKKRILIAHPVILNDTNDFSNIFELKKIIDEYL